MFDDEKRPFLQTNETTDTFRDTIVRAPNFALGLEFTELRVATLISALDDYIAIKMTLIGNQNCNSLSSNLSL